MNWVRGDDYHIRSEPSGYVINKAEVRGRLQYMAVKLGTPWKRRDAGPVVGWDGSNTIHIEYDVDPIDESARLEALRKCKAICEDDARE